MANEMCTVFLLPFKSATLHCSSREVQTTSQCVHAGFHLFLAASMSSSRPWDYGAARYKRLDGRFVETKKKYEETLAEKDTLKEELQQEKAWNQLKAKELFAVKKEAMDLRNRCEQQRKELLEKESETVLRMQQQRSHLTDTFKQREKDLEEKLHRHYKNKELANEGHFETRLQKRLAGQREELERQHSKQMDYAKKLIADLKEAGWF